MCASITTLEIFEVLSLSFIIVLRPGWSIEHVGNKTGVDYKTGSFGAALPCSPTGGSILYHRGNNLSNHRELKNLLPIDNKMDPHNLPGYS